MRWSTSTRTRRAIMAKKNIRNSDPARYARVAAEQEALRSAYSSQMRVARLCPYCDHKIEILCRGTHGGSYNRCPNCGEQVFFPPISFRMR